MIAAILALGWALTRGDHFPPMYTAAIVILSLGFLVHTWRNRESGWFSVAVEFVAVLGIIAFLDFVLGCWEARAPHFGLYSVVAAPMLNLVGIQATTSMEYLCINAFDGLVRIVPSMEKVGLRDFILFVSAWFLFSIPRFRQTTYFRTMTFLGTAIAFTIFRFIVCVGIYSEFDKILSNDNGAMALAVFHGLISTAVHFVALGFLAETQGFRQTQILIVQPEKKETVRPDSVRTKAVLTFLLAVCVILAGLVYLPGKAKSGKVLIDDRLGGQWEPTARLLDKDWYGDFSTYSFSSLTEWIGHFYHVDVNTSQTYDKKLLDQYDVLILKTPEKSLASEEVEAIQSWVENGGGLFLIGDHTNLLGMSTRLNELIEKYGVTFRFDAASTGYSGGFNFYQKPVWATHPSANEVDELLFLTSCTLDLDYTTQAITTVGDCRKSPHDYAGGSFFSSSRSFPDQEYGRAVLSAVKEVGQGKIGMFTDSTVFSSFGFFMYDTNEQFLGMVASLNREKNPWTFALRLGSVFCVLCMLYLATGLIFSGRPVLALFLVAFGIWTGVVGTELCNSSMHVRPEPRAEISEVAFINFGCRSAYPPTLGGLGNLPAEYAFDTFFVSTQRLGLAPRFVSKSANVFQPQTKVVVAISPIELADDAWFKQLDSFVKNGGHLLVIDEISAPSPTNGVPMLRKLGLDIQRFNRDDGGLHIQMPSDMERITFTENIFGGSIAWGKGSICFLVDASEFSREGMGHCFNIPRKDAKEIYDTVFFVFENIFGQNVGDRRYYGIL